MRKAITFVLALLAASALLDDGVIERARTERYAAWSDELGTAIMDGSQSLADLRDRALARSNEPQPVSGRQEMLENAVAAAIERVR